MTDILIRDVPDDVLSAIDASCGESRRSSATSMILA